MRNKFLRVLIAVLVTGLLTTSSVFAEDVCVTKQGKKYHKMGSRFIKGREYEVISREEAEARGYKPSSDFFRDNAADDGTGKMPAESDVADETDK